MKNIILTLSVLLAAASFAPTGFSQDEATAAAAPDAETLAAAKRLVEVADMKSLIENSYGPALDAQMGQMSQMGMSDEGLAELKTAMLEFFKTAMPYAELEPFFVNSYATRFTKEELNEITAFYQTPTGKKALQLTPELMAEGMQKGQAMVQAKMPELQAIIMPIVQKHMKVPGAQ